MSTNIRKAQVMKEMEEKNRKIRLRWYEKHFEVLKAAKKEDEDVEISPMLTFLIEEVARMRKDRFARDRAIEAKVKAEKAAKREGKPSEEEIDPEIIKRGPMFPVEKEVKDILYKGISSNKEGRWLYLRIRNNKAPYDKYYDPQSMTNLYGWKIEETASPANKQFARHSVIAPQFYRRTGVKGETLRNRPPELGMVSLEILS